MPQLATITSKRQLTIPVSIFEKLFLEKGTRVVVQEKKGRMIIQPVKALIKELSGSVALPKRFKGLSIEQMIKKAKQEYFAERK